MTADACPTCGHFEYRLRDDDHPSGTWDNLIMDESTIRVVVQNLRESHRDCRVYAQRRPVRSWEDCDV